MDSRIKKNAQELALKFEADSDIPDRLKSGKLKTSSERISETLVEKRFQKHLDDWIDAWLARLPGNRHFVSRDDCGLDEPLKGSEHLT